MPDFAIRSISGCTLIIKHLNTKSDDLLIAYRFRGIAYDAQRDYNRAIADYSTAISLDGRAATDFSNRGRAYHAQKDNDRALADYTEAIRLDTESGGSFGVVEGGEGTTIYYERGLAYQENGEVEKAVADYRKAIKIDPDYRSPLEVALQSSLSPSAYQALVSERNAKKIADLLDVLKVPSIDFDTRFTTYSKLNELDPGNLGYKQETDKLAKQIAARDAAKKAAEEKAQKEAELRIAEEKRAELQLKDCRSDWAKCVDNEQLANNYSQWSGVKFFCKKAANESAKYGDPQWPWFAFSTFLKGKDYVATGIAVAIENDVRFQNGFSAMVHSRVTCSYDLRSRRVLNVDVLPR